MKTQSLTIRLAPTNSFLPFLRQFVPTLLLAGSLAATPALGSPGGELDPAFGDHGRILLRDTRFEELRGVEAFVDSGSGKLLAVASGWRHNALLRFDGDGSLDLSFGDQGTVPLDFGDDSLDIYDVELLPDGRLLIAGAMNVYGDPDNVIHGSALLARMQADGTPDDSFGSEGRVILELGGAYESFAEILVQADGGIVVFGSTDRTRRTERILARYTKDGSRDTSFGSSATPGTSVIDVDRVNGKLAAIVQQGDGTFMACGDATSTTGSSTSKEILAVSVQSNGLPDTSFGDNGLALIGGGQQSLEIHNCLPLADGHLAIAGSLGSGEQQRAAAFRMTPDGRLDGNFGNNGLALLPTEMPSAAYAMLVMTDGSLAIAGTHLNPNKNGWYLWADMLVARIDPTTGEFDRDFGDRGVTAVDFGTRGHIGFAIPASLIQQPDGKLVAIGSQIDRGDWWDTPSIAITRADPYGSGSNGWAGLSETYANVPPGGGDVALHIRRTGGSTGQLSVDYRTVDDTATAGTDYVAKSGTLTWPDGDMSDRRLSITVLNAQLAANSESFQVELSNSSGGLATDQAIIGICCDAPSGGTPPPAGGGGGGGSNSASGNSGGGAAGIELLFLMALAAFRLLRRACQPAR